jgi:hypothetical protein
MHKALDSDQARVGPVLFLIAQLYRVEEQARGWNAEARLGLRQRESRPILDKLHEYLLEMQAEVLPKSPEGRAVRYTLKNWTALHRYSEDGDLEIDNNHTRAQHSRRSGWPQQLDLLWKRPGRPYRRGAEELRGFLSARGSRSLRLVQGCPLAHRRPSHQPTRRTATA